jgi:hypothetical protein
MLYAWRTFSITVIHRYGGRLGETEMLDRTTTKTFSGAALCADVEQFVAVMFGPQQHDHHMRPYRAEKINATNRAAWAQMNAEIAAAGSYTAWLRGSK